jgi:hypothetical protein
MYALFVFFSGGSCVWDFKSWHRDCGPGRLQTGVDHEGAFIRAYFVNASYFPSLSLGAPKPTKSFNEPLGC